MKQHIFSKGGLLLAFLSVFLSFFACRHDLRETLVLPDETSTAAMTAEIEVAKVWFDNYQKESSLAESSKFKKMTPVWSRAISVHNVVEVPFTIDEKFYLPSLQQANKKIGRRKLVIYKNRNNGRKGYVVDYMPSETFVGKIKDINSINFRQAKFSGMIDVYNLNHVNLGGFMYEKGKFVQRYHEDTGASNGKEEDNCTYTVVQVCDLLSDPIVCYDALEVTCKKPGGGGGGGGGDECDGPEPPPTCMQNPCDGPEPPSYCGNGDPCQSNDPPPSCGDPCNGPTPPPNCDGGGGGGDCNGQPCNPCDLDPTLPECNECNPCTDTYDEHQNFAEVDFDIFTTVYITLGDVKYNLAATGANCSQQTYGSTTLSHRPDIIWPFPWTLSRDYEYSNEISREKINPRDANCGFKLNMKCGGQAKLELFGSTLANIPITRTWIGYANLTFD